MIVVLDPSAAVEILLKRNNSTILQRLLIEAETVISPDLYIAEISNVAWKYYKLAKYSHEQTISLAEDGINLIDTFIPTNELWKESGADRYLMRHETASEKLYNFLHPDSSFEMRVKHLKTLKKLGYETGAGCMVGLPGQGPKELALDLIFLRELDADMVGIGPFIPHQDTPLGKEKAGDLKMCLKMIALTRLLIPDSNIPATTAMGSIHPNGRELALKVGANVIMPNLTPAKYKPLYQLYPNKICVFESDMRCIPCMKKMITNLNRKVGTGFGSRKRTDVIHFEKV